MKGSSPKMYYIKNVQRKTWVESMKSAQKGGGGDLDPLDSAPPPLPSAPDVHY